MSMITMILVGYTLGILIGYMICLIALGIFLIISSGFPYHLYDFIKRVIRPSQKKFDNIHASEDFVLLAKNLSELSNYGVTYEEACINISKNIKALD